MEDEFKIQITIVPENYEYNEEEIVYRIYFEDQLISERSLPILKPNQGIVDTFYLSIPISSSKNKLIFNNCKSKKALMKYINLNGYIIQSAGNFFYQKRGFEVSEYKINT